RTTLKSRGGKTLANIEETDGRLSLVMDRRQNRAFADYLVRRLPDLYDTFAAEEAEPPSRANRR
ncbi:MAG: hypothetical protein ACRCTI_04580, partial [Beijerinckiaceae bacterium]